jgi:hypothetical protein
MIIRNSKNGSIVNLDKVTQIYPSISEKSGIFNLYFIFDAMNNEECNEVKWEFGSVDEIERILLRLDITEV